MGLIGFDIVTTHNTLNVTLPAVRRLLKTVDLKVPDTGLWGPYKKGPAASRIEFVIPEPADLDHAIDRIVSYETAFSERMDETSFPPDQRAHLTRQELVNYGNVHPRTFVDHVVSGMPQVQSDIRWLKLWWSNEAETRDFWTRITEKGTWISLKDFLTESGNPESWSN